MSSLRLVSVGTEEQRELFIRWLRCRYRKATAKRAADGLCATKVGVLGCRLPRRQSGTPPLIRKGFMATFWSPWSLSLKREAGPVEQQKRLSGLQPEKH